MGLLEGLIAGEKMRQAQALLPLQQALLQTELGRA
jgi:hypothetical protein